MLIKHRPEDFVVEELTSFEPQQKGPVSVYEVRKRKVDTFEAIRRIASAADLPLDRIKYAGLKDRQAVTTQLISVVDGQIPKKLKLPHIRIRYLGRAPEPLTAADLDGNKFKIVVRDLDGDDLAGLRDRVTAVRRGGIINYFDDQRFGTLRRGQGLPGRLLVRGMFEAAVKMLIAAEDPRDPPPDRSFKSYVRRSWGDWPTIAKKWGNRRNASIVRHLARKPTDYAGALQRMPGKERAIHIFAFQSLIWNESVGRYLTAVTSGQVSKTPYAAGELIWPEREVDLIETFPLIDHTVAPDDPVVAAAIEATLAAEHLSIPEFKIEGIQGCFFKHHERPLRIRPGDLEVDRPHKDDERPGRQKIALSFTLPPGAYATLILKRLFGRAPEDASHRNSRPWNSRSKKGKPKPASKPKRRVVGGADGGKGKGKGKRGSSTSGRRGNKRNARPD